MWLPLAGLLLLWPVGRAGAQVAWDAPWLVPPGVAGEGLGVHLVDVSGGGLGLAATWRSPRGGYGLRGGIVEAAGDEIGIFGGIDFSGRLARATSEQPLEVDWVFGAGLGVADWVRLSVPVGITVGHTFREEGAAFTPYVTPRLFFDALFGGDGRGPGDNDDADLGLAVDIGLDVQLPNTGFLIRFGGSLGDREAVSLGLVF